MSEYLYRYIFCGLIGFVTGVLFSWMLSSPNTPAPPPPQKRVFFSKTIDRYNTLIKDYRVRHIVSTDSGYFFITDEI